MRRTVNNLISVIFTFIKFSIMKIFCLSGFIFSPIERFSPNVVTEFNCGSRVTLGKMVRVHSGTKIKVRKGARLSVGSNAKINYNCIIVCHDNIEIGEGTEFGPSVYLYDHDHDYQAGIKNGKFKSSSIAIGKNCWVGANTIILRGTKIGDNCVIGAGSVIKGTFSDGSVIVQKREIQARNMFENKH